MSGLPPFPPPPPPAASFGTFPVDPYNQQWPSNLAPNVPMQPQALNSFYQQADPYGSVKQSVMPGLTAGPPPSFSSASASGPGSFPATNLSSFYPCLPIPPPGASHAFYPPPPPPPIPQQLVAPSTTSDANALPSTASLLDRPVDNNTLPATGRSNATATSQPKDMDDREEGELTGDEGPAPTSYVSAMHQSPSPPKDTGSQYVGTVNESIGITSKLKSQAQDALRMLHAHNIRFEDMVKEGVDKDILRKLYEEAGLEMPPPPQEVPRAAVALTSPAQKPTKSSKAAEAPISGKEKTKMAKDSTTSLAQQTTQPTNAAKSAEDKPMERKDLIARMLALRAKKQASPTDAPADSLKAQLQTQTQAPPPPGDPLAQPQSQDFAAKEGDKEVKAKEKSKEQTELAKQRIKQLKSKVSVPQKPSISTEGASTGNDRTLSETKGDQAPGTAPSLPGGTLQHPLPLRPASSVAPSSSLPATTAPRIPGLFMSAPAIVAGSATIARDVATPEKSSTTSTTREPMTSTATASTSSSAKTLAITASVPASLPAPAPLSGPASTIESPAPQVSETSSAEQSFRKRPRAVDFNEEPADFPHKRSSEQRVRVNMPRQEPRVVIEFSDDDSADELDYGEADNEADERQGAVPSYVTASDQSRDLPSRPETANLRKSQTSSPLLTPGSLPGSGKPTPGSDTYLKELTELKERIAKYEQKKKKKRSRVQPEDQMARDENSSAATVSGDPAILEQKQSHPEESRTRSDTQTPQALDISAAPSTLAQPPSQAPSITTTATQSVVTQLQSTATPSISLDTNEHRRKTLRKKVILSGLQTLCSQIETGEKRLEELREEEERLHADLGNKQARHSRLRDELRVLEEELANFGKQQRQADAEPASGSTSKKFIYTDDETYDIVVDTLPAPKASPEQKHADNRGQAETAEARAEEQALYPSAVDDLIRESQPQSPEAQVRVLQVEGVNVEEGNATKDEDQLMEESAHVDDTMDESAPENPSGDVPPEERRSTLGKIAIDEKSESIEKEIAEAEESDTMSAEEENKEAEEDAHPAQKPPSEDVEMRAVETLPDSADYEPADASTQQVDLRNQQPLLGSDDYEPADAVLTSLPPVGPAADHYEPPEPVTAAPPDLKGMDAQHRAEAAEVASRAVHQRFDELTFNTKESTPASAPLTGNENLQEPPESKYQPKYYKAYVSPLRFFKSYRYHPLFTKDVAGGYRSLTYSNNVNPVKELCAFELSGGTCNDPSCEHQHFRDLVLSDDLVLLQLGQHREGQTPEERENYVAGLRKTINDMREQNVKDFETVASEITAYRRRFLGDDTRVLTI